MSVQNVVIGTVTEKKHRGRPKGSTNKDAAMKKVAKKIVVIDVNEAHDWFDGSDNEGANIDLLLSGKKLIWRKHYQIYMSNLKRHGPVDDFKYFDSKKYEEPHFIIFDKKLKKIIFDVPGEMGKGFLALCSQMNIL
jgi:hypothetical protein